MLTRFDELPHAIDPLSEHWRESWYLNFFDHEQELYGVAWMGVRPNVGHGEAMFAVGKGNRFLIRFEDFRIPIPADIGGERVAVGPLRFDVIEPYRHWKITYESGDDRVELEWRALTAVYNWEFQRTSRSWHYQHPGTIVGEMTIGGKRYSFEGYGERDRAWGRRDNSYFNCVHWITAQFPQGRFVHAMHSRHAAGTDMFGFVQDEGRASLISDLGLDVAYAYRGGVPVRANLDIVDREGRRFQFKQEIMNAIIMGGAAGGSETRLCFTFHRFESDGMRGYGMMDHWWSDFAALGDHYHATEPNRGSLYPLDLYGNSAPPLR